MIAAPQTRRALQVLIVDDEPLAREDLAQLLLTQPGVTLVGKCATGAEALAVMRRQMPDVLLLDIRMPGLDGFNVLSRLDPGRMPYVVFVTASARYAVEAFRVDALDYVLKPVRPSRLAAALDRARERSQLRTPREVATPGNAVAEAQGWSDVIVRVGAREIVVRLSDVVWMEADTYYVRLHLQSRSYLLRERMHILEANLDANRFVRVHRSAIVNIEHVSEIRHDGGGEHSIVLSTGRVIKASRPRWPRFRAAMRERAKGGSPPQG